VWERRAPSRDATMAMIPRPVRAFVAACRAGDTNAARAALVQVDEEDVHWGEDAAFRALCAHGDVEGARWLYDRGGVDVHAVMDNAVRSAARNGHLPMVQWLHGVGADIRAGVDWPLLCAAGGGHAPVVYWLVETIGAQDIERWLMQLVVDRATQNGFPDLAEWLAASQAEPAQAQQSQP